MKLNQCLYQNKYYFKLGLTIKPPDITLADVRGNWQYSNVGFKCCSEKVNSTISLSV